MIFSPTCRRVALVVAVAGLAGGSRAEAPARVRSAPRAPSPADPRSPEYDRWSTVRPGEWTGYNQRASLVQRGKLVYQGRCSGCHGPRGDGKGPAAARLLTKPRDFTSGIFKFRSTNSESLPLESDLHRTITRGLARVSMPGFPLMPEPDKLAVIEYLKTFYPRWERRKGERVVVAVPRAPGDLASPERPRRGRAVYIAMQCGTCHGGDGRGGETVFQDAWGNPQTAFDFTRGRLKGGDDPEDIYRTFHTGLISVMPEFGGTLLAAVTRDALEKQKARVAPREWQDLLPSVEAFPATLAEVGLLAPAAVQELAERNSWDLVAYILSLRRPASTAAAVLPTPAAQPPGAPEVGPTSTGPGSGSTPGAPARGGTR